jgi:acetyl-CoA decarbonylase/synthase complex subunit gamma
MIAVRNDSGNAEAFENAVKAVADKTCFATVLVSEDPIAMEKALGVIGGSNPLICGATEANYEKMVELAKKYNCPLAVKGNGLDSTADLVEKISASYKELVIDLGTRQLSQELAEITQTRRLAIKKKFRPFGYPVIAFTASEDPKDEVLEASTLVAKYASIIVIKADEKSQILPLMALRMNLYTDPQKPSQVEPMVYAIGAVTKDSPVYVTTNFSLTYYTVEGEISGSKIPSYIIACPTDGTSVLTAWAAGKFSGEKIAEFLKTCGIEEKVNHKNIVIPGYVAVIKGALEEKSGWNVIVGPAEASGLPAFAKSRFA